MRRFLIWIPLVLYGCITEVEFPEVDCQGEAEVEVLLELKGCTKTRSSLILDEYAIRDIDVVIYRDGLLALHEHRTDPDARLRLSLAEGYSYDIYVLANWGEHSALTYERDFQDRCVYEVSSISELSGPVPMVWNKSGVVAESGMDPVQVQLDRLVAKVTFSIDDEFLKGLLVTSARMCQCAAAVHPFRDYGGVGSKVESVGEVIDGDYATPSDLSDLNDGGQMTFYVLENCQGVLLPDNSKPSGKLPDQLGDKAELCTYLEIDCIFDGEGFLEGEVTYRFYLGLDSFASFDIPGNSCIDVALQLTDTGLREVSWRVDADVSVREGYAWGRVEKGMHQMDELYVGERLLYRVEVSDEILSYVGGDASGCTLQYSGEGSMGFTALMGSGNVYTSEITCTSSGQGVLYLCGPEGQRLAKLDPDVMISPPYLLFSEYSTWQHDEPVEPLTYRMDCIINGAGTEVFLYLVDKDKFNLNSSDAYGFDFSLFDFSLQSVAARSDVSDAMSVNFYRGTPLSEGYVSKMVVKCRHDGNGNSLPYALAEVFGSRSDVSLTIGDSAHGVISRCKFGLGIVPVTLRLVDNGWAGYHQTQLSMVVDNVSAIPLDITVYQMLDSNDDWSSSKVTEQLKNYVNNNLTRTPVSYITGEVRSWDQVMHVSKAVLNNAGNGVWPLEGISTDDLLKSLTYDGFGNDRMYHVVDVTADGWKLTGEEVRIVDSLSDGSSKYNTIYMNSKGIWLYSNNTLVSSAGNYLVHFPNLTPMNLDSMKRRYNSCPSLYAQLWFDNGQFRIFTPYVQGSNYGIKMSIRFSGTVTGYVQTDPKGIWGSKQDNYCYADFGRTTKGVPLSSFNANVSADGGTVQAAMDAIYAQTFEDKKNGSKFQHSAHPISMDCLVAISVEGDAGKELYPLRFTWESTSVGYYHAQDACTYSCKMVTEVPVFNMVFVEN